MCTSNLRQADVVDLSYTEEMMGRVEELCGSLRDEQGPLAECIVQMVRNIFGKLSMFENGLKICDRHFYDV